MRRGPPRPSRKRPRPRVEPPFEVVFGVRAALAVFEVRPDDVRSVHVASEQRRAAASLAAWAGSNQVRFEETHPLEIERIAGSSLHEGLCVVTRPRRFASPKELTARLRATGGVAIAFDRIRNPYNIGSILRTAAFFGLEGALFGSSAPQPTLTADAVRVAEGGAEHLTLARTTDLSETLRRLQGDGVRVIGVESDGREDALLFRYERPAVLVVGHEREGLSPRVRDVCDSVVSIRGAGNMESLNVAVAASLVMAAARTMA